VVATIDALSEWTRLFLCAFTDAINDTYEPIVEALSHGFHAFLKDNVLLVCDICGIQFQLGAIDGGEEVPEDAA